MTGCGAHADAVIAGVAGRQFGVVAFAHLLDAGVSRHEIRRRVESGHLIRLHRGVYAVGHAGLHPLAPHQAALLAVGPGSALSHRTAAELHRMLAPTDHAIHVTTTSRSRPPRIVVHHARRLPRRRHHHGLPLTAPLATLEALARTEPPATTDRAVAEAMALRLVTPRQVANSASPRVRAGAVTGITRSEAERRFLALVTRAGLPRPLTNQRIAHFELDAIWPEQRVAVEIDGYAFHHSRRSFERDREKEAVLDALGWKLIRLTWRQITEAPEAVALRLANALRR